MEYIKSWLIRIFTVAIIIITLAWFLSFIARAAEYQVQPVPTVKTDIWDGYSLLKRITSCESWGDPNKEPRQFDTDGRVLLGFPNPKDIGLAQINLPTWGEKAKDLGFDLWTYGGNLNMAKWIFDHYGSKPWKYSKGCWNS